MSQQITRISQRIEFLEKLTGNTVDYMSGGKYFIRPGKHHVNIELLNKDIKVLGLEVKTVTVNDGGSLTFSLGVI